MSPADFNSELPDGLRARTEGVSGLDAPTGRARKRFIDEDADLLVAPVGSWAVKGIWPRVGVCFVVAPSGAGKSFWTLAQISNIAQGAPVLGSRSTRSGVVYVASEGASGLRGRFEGLRERNGPWGGRIRFIAQAPNLADEEEVAALIEDLAQIAESQRRNGGRLGIVVIDTLSAAMPGVDENSSRDMSGVLQSLQSIAAELEVCVIVVAHHGKDIGRGIRGWSGAHANADGVIFIDAATEDGVRIGTVAKVKDGEAGMRFAFELRQVRLGEDEDGDDITTCVVHESEVPTAKVRSTTVVKAGEATILQAFGRLEDTGLAVPEFPGVRAGTLGLKLADLREAVFNMGFHSETQPVESSGLEYGRWLEARKKAFQRGMQKLVERGSLRHESGFVWRLGTRDGTSGR